MGEKGLWVMRASPESATPPLRDESSTHPGALTGRPHLDERSDEISSCDRLDFSLRSK